MIFEDAYWAGSTSLELLGRAVERIACLPALLAVTFRPGFAARWVGQPYVRPFAIDRLEHHDANAMTKHR